MAQKPYWNLGDTQITLPDSNQDHYSNIGLIRSNWYNSRGKLRGYNYGTAFIVSKRILMTCTHNVYSDIFGRDADSVEFVYGLKSGKVS